MTGLRLNDDWDYRLSLNYRDQKGNIGKSNKTFASGFDMPINNKFSFGEFIIDNNSINNSLNTFNFMLSAAYKLTHANRDGADKHNLSVGLQAGLLQQSFNQNNFVFDSQYSSMSTNGFDTNLPNGESFTKNNSFNFDANMGVYYRFIDMNKKYSPFGGFSIYHLTRPNQSYTATYSQTPMRYTLQGGCLFTLNETFSVLPQFLYMNQAKAQNLNIGIMGFEKIRNTNYQPMLGVAWRSNDAVILQVGLKYKTGIVRISYDINTSYLNKYGNQAVELSVIYTFKKKTPPPPIAQPAKDSTTSFIPKTAPASISNNVSTAPSESTTPAKVKKDTASSPLPKTNGRSPIVSDSPYELFQKSSGKNSAKTKPSPSTIPVKPKE